MGPEYKIKTVGQCFFCGQPAHIITHKLNPQGPDLGTEKRTCIECFPKTLPALPPAKPSVSDRITQYLSAGGLFNPECMDHDKVRALLIDARDQLDYLENSLK